jgi:hypothetical protein
VGKSDPFYLLIPGRLLLSGRCYGLSCMLTEFLVVGRSPVLLLLTFSRCYGLGCVLAEFLVVGRSPVLLLLTSGR